MTRREPMSDERLRECEYILGEITSLYRGYINHDEDRESARNAQEDVFAEIRRLREIGDELNNEIFSERMEKETLLRENEWLKSELKHARREAERLWNVEDDCHERIIKYFEHQQKLIEALRFYADERSYSYSDISMPEVLGDLGVRAREALKVIENE